MKINVRFEFLLLFLVGLGASLLFFMDYPSQDPRSSAGQAFNKKEIHRLALKRLEDLGYSLKDYEVSRISVMPREHLLDSLQRGRGRAPATAMLADSTSPNLKPFVWQVTLVNKNKPRIPVQIDSDSGRPIETNALKVQIDQAGHFIALLNPTEQLPRERVNRAALGRVFQQADSLGQQILPTVSDSMLSHKLIFNLDRGNLGHAGYAKTTEKRALHLIKRGIPYLHSKNDARALADFYLKKTGWDRQSLIADTVFIKRIGTVNAADVRYQTRKPVRGQQLRLDVTVSPAGELLGLEPAYNQQAASAGISQSSFWEIIQVILEFIFLIIVFVVFFFRMRARSIDTGAALMIAIFMGVIMITTIFLGSMSNFNPFTGTVDWNQLAGLLFGLSLMAAFIAVTSFVLFAVSDSLTRQYWPEKIATWDHLQQGALFSKPLGRVMLRSAALAFILVAFWTGLLHLFPRLSIQIKHVYLSDAMVWPPLKFLLSNIWRTFSLMFSIFLIIGNWAYGRTKNRWIAGGCMVLACGIAMPVIGDFTPLLSSFLISLLLGAALAFIYLRWDFLTLLLSQFLFLGLIGSATGWMVADSPDIYVFVSVMAVWSLVVIVGAAAVIWGRDEDRLTEYVPGYIEELAQEQRIKQELQIAREVQQSFLPSRTPAMMGLDLAATCRPAHETGGDYYDFIPLDDHRIAVAIGDVSGKGIQAAFYMTLLKGMLHSLCREIDSPAEVLIKANQLFFDNATKGTFVSLIYGIINVKKKTFAFARAGHNPILRINISSGEVKELQPGGLGLGLTKEKIFDNKIQEIELSITQDDLFLLYTDGIVEALNLQHEFFGSDKLEQLISEKRHDPAASIVEAISKRVTQFMADTKQHDDMTLLAIRFIDAIS